VVLTLPSSHASHVTRVLFLYPHQLIIKIFPIILTMVIGPFIASLFNRLKGTRYISTLRRYKQLLDPHILRDGSMRMLSGPKRGDPGDRSCLKYTITSAGYHRRIFNDTKIVFIKLQANQLQGVGFPLNICVLTEARAAVRRGN